MTREEAIDWLCRLKSEIKIFMPYQWQKPFEEALDMAIKALEQEPKTGHWIEEFVDTEGEVRFTCSCCGKYQLFGTDFCYNCGAKMEEVEDENVNKRSI